MVAASVLDGKTTVSVSNGASATSTPSNFVIQASPADVANYARQGNDLIVEMKSGQVHTIRNFAAQGMGFNNLVLEQGQTQTLVNLKLAASAGGDGIIDAMVTTQTIGVGASTAALAGILGVAAAGGGIAVASGGSDSKATSPIDPIDPTNPVDPTNPSVPTDRTPPSAPSGFGISMDTGSSATDGVTSDNTLVFSGRAEANSNVQVFVNGLSIGTVKADANGNWSLDHRDTPMANGTYALTARATDAAGNISSVSETYAFVVDTVAPRAPSIISSSSDTGHSATDRITSDNTLTFMGTAEENTTVEVFLNGTSIGKTVTDENGVWDFDYSGTILADGTYTVTAQASDIAGNNSSVSAPYSVTIDTVAPQSPIISAISTDAGLSPAGSVTSDNTLLFVGTTEPNASVEVKLDGDLIGTVTADANGNWSLDYTGTVLVNGNYKLTAQAIDVAGNTSSVSSEFAFTVNYIPQTFSLTIDGNGSANGGLITFTFAEAIDPQSFSEGDIVVRNGVLNVGSLTQVNATTWTATVTPDLGASNTNVAVTLTAGSVQNSAGLHNAEGRNITTLNGLFDHNSALAGDVTGWDASHANSAVGTFDNTTFNQNIGAWDVSNVKDMTGMFATTPAFNQNIGGWDVGSVTNMTAMFTSASAFNQDIDDWDVSNVTDMNSMFLRATAFNGEIGSWDVSSVTDMTSMFGLATSFNKDIGAWNVANVTNMNGMLQNATSFDQGIGGWNVSNVTDMAKMFAGAAAFNKALGSWNVSSVTTMASMFSGATAFNGDIGGWNVSSVIGMASMFSNATAFNDDIGNWMTGNVTAMSTMFANASSFNQDIGGWNVGNVTNMTSMFSGATSFNQDIGNWDVSRVAAFGEMFSFAASFNQDIGGWNLANAQDLYNMFYDATSFNQDVSGWNVSGVNALYGMFNGAAAFNQNLADWDISSVTNAANMFTSSGMSVENMDDTLRGWAKLDTSTGETTIQNNVNWGIATYSDATARQYLIDHHNWSINGILATGTAVGNASADVLDYSSSSVGITIHGLGGSDTIIGGAGNDWIVGGAGDDRLTGNGGQDTFHFGFDDAGFDTITDFQFGTGGDIVHLADLLIGYNPTTSNVADFINLYSVDGDLVMAVDHDGPGGANTQVTIMFEGDASHYVPTLLDDMIANGNLVLA